MKREALRREPVRRAALRCTALGLVLASGLCACAPQDGPAQAIRDDATLLSSDVPAADLALAALAKGEYPRAERFVTRALQANDRDPYALLAAGLLYQNTNRPADAARVYQTLLALRPAEEAAVGSWFRLQKRPITEIASGNLEILNMLPATAQAANGARGEQMASVRPPAPAADASATPASAAGPGPRALVPGSPAPEPSPAPVPRVGGAGGAAMPVVPPASAPVVQSASAAMGAPMAALPGAPPASALSPQATTAVMGRFLGLNRLLTDGLITQEDYAQRREANLGALLPLTHKPPAPGLTRPAPAPDEVEGRLVALRETLQQGAMTPEQHGAERAAILEALLPANPGDHMMIMVPPRTMEDGSAAVNRVRALRAAGLISEAEMAAEVGAIERSVRSSLPGGASRASASTGHAGARANGAHLASYHNEASAREAWAEMSRRYPALRGQSPHYAHVNAGAKGPVVRLLVGPLASPAAVDQLCASLKRAGQYCAPTTL
ncbi:SPOR domain-containing protein [Pararhodospirillum oryzae]|uniref:SPOR domain-containing protein n=1 Tax=Pararhodospirillum oryzae TaxID=478448 RepID=A0A512H9R3_9PROT|nr:SPOR domain-containing protein [Pararhodospirillum oryzae]GEO82185.1 hypothetical protein ROR02_23160 [Pararhodospirillum oryzae]